VLVHLTFLATQRKKREPWEEGVQSSRINHILVGFSTYLPGCP
jgi:hypothetical protein